MSHIKTQVREKVAVLLTGLATTGANVFRSRTRVIPESKLPALKISTPQEANDYGSVGYPRLVNRKVLLQIEVLLKDNDEFDDKVDVICLEIEKKLTATVANLTLGGTAKDMTLIRTDTTFGAEADRPTGTATMLWEVSLQTLETAPDTAL